MNQQRLQRFLNPEGQLQQWPAKHADKQLVLGYLAEKFRPNTSYHEREVNDILKAWHTFSDWPLLRRALVDSGYLQRNRDGTDYRRVSQIP